MDYFQSVSRQAKIVLIVCLALVSALVGVEVWLFQSVLGLEGPMLVLAVTALATGQSVLAAFLLSAFLLQPLKAMWQAILHVSPGQNGVQAPKVEHLSLGGDLVTNLTNQLHQLSVQTQESVEQAQVLQSDLHNNFIAQNFPLPIIVLDGSDNITYANEAAVEYIGIAGPDMIGKNVYMVLDMSFPSNDTFDTWLKESKSAKATATGVWERVRLNVRDNHPARLFDLAVYYNRDNTHGMETIVTLFDHSKMYSQDEQAVSFIALSVHELRTPLTLLRGYIEVFEEEISQQSDPELQSFMNKMRSQAEQLTAFVNNILNVARIDDDQLELQLQEEEWPTILKSAIEMISLRAKVRDITLKCSVQTNLPTVGVDRLSIREVINNLIDNAIKYSGDSKVIEIDSRLNKDGLVETTIRDYGLGISNSILPNLFTKFYRDHRNRAQIGGTGLGLYLSKAIVDAHGGSVWVQSNEGQGSTFGFTLVPYTQMTEDLKNTGNQEITRSAHGWIKNHSLYRR